MAQLLGQLDRQTSQERRPIAELLALAGPTVAQMASYTIMQFVDTWMLTRISDDAATAASNSGMFAFSVISLGVGVLLLVNTLVSQHYGQRTFAACGRYLWQGVWFSVFFSLLLLPVVPLVRRAFVRFGHAPDLVQLETVYLQIVIGASVAKLAGTAFGQFLLAINRPNVVLASAVIGVTANILTAYVMVLGHLGLKPMGVTGAAWAQNVGVTVETCALIWFATRRNVRGPYGVRNWEFRRREFTTLIRVGIPSGIQIAADVLAWSLFVAWVVGAFGTKAMAANTYMFRFMVVSFMPAIGIGTAVTALVGRYIGRGRRDMAETQAHLGFRLAFLYMLACGLFFYFGRHLLMGLFTRDPEVLAIGATLLAFAAVYQVFDAMYIIYTGALRGAGDTLVPSLVTGLLCWGMMLFGGYLVARYAPEWGVTGPWLAATAYGIVLGLFMLTRFRFGGWKRICLEDDPRLAKVRGLEAVATAADGGAASNN
jgi:MATE family multidrug resistance protein